AGWLARRLALAFYLGLAPVLLPFGLRRDGPFVRHHAAQAQMLVLGLLAFFVGCLLYGLLLTYLLLYHRAFYESFPIFEGWSLPQRDALLPALVGAVWLLAWVGGVVLAILGSTRGLPLIARLARRPRWLWLAWVVNVLLLGVALLTTAAALHASSLTRDDDEPAPVYLLYDDMGVLPRWIFTLGFYRISLAANARWGPGS